MDKYILISIHDVNPVFEKEINSFLKELHKRNINKFSMLITPFYEGNNTTKKFANSIKKNKHCELILHGYDHGDGTYLDSDRIIILTQINKGLRELREYYKIKPRGYVPPCWKSSKKLEKALKDMFDYTEDFTKITYFNKRKSIRSLPLGMESMTNNKLFKYDKATPLLTRLISNIYARSSRSNVLRYALHPREVNNGNFKATLRLLDYLIKKGFKPITYSELEKII